LKGRAKLIPTLRVENSAHGRQTAKGISFSSDRDGHEEIYVMMADGSRQTRLTETHRTEIN
jgi:hypothetical protein